MKPGIWNRESGIGRAVCAMLLVCMLLAGCSILGDEREAATLYAPDPRVVADPAWPQVDWQLSIAQPRGARMIDSLRIAVRPTPDEVQVYKGAGWAKRPGDMLADTIARTLEDSGKLGAVVREGSGGLPDYKLLLDMRRFEADYAGNPVPAATIEVNAKLLHLSDQQIVASKTFLQDERATDADVDQVVDAFSRSLGKISGDIAGWVLASGDAHERSAHTR